MRRRDVQAIGAAPIYDEQRDHFAAALRADGMGDRVLPDWGKGSRPLPGEQADAEHYVPAVTRTK